MLVAEHGRVPHSLAGWQVAVMVLRYFVAVLMVGEKGTSHWVHLRHRCVDVGLVGLEQTTYGLRELSGCACWRDGGPFECSLSPFLQRRPAGTLVGVTGFGPSLFVPCEAQTRLKGALRRSGQISLSLLYLPCFCCCTGSKEALTISSAGL